MEWVCCCDWHSWFCFTVTWKHSCAQNLKSKTNLVMDDKVYRIVDRVSYRNTHSIYYRVISYTTLFDSYPLSCENRLFVWLYCECAVCSVCVYPCTSARLLGSLMDVTCLHNPPWESCYGSVAESQHESMSWRRKGRQGPHCWTEGHAGILKKHTYTSSNKWNHRHEWAGK